MQRNILIREKTGLESDTDLEIIESMALGNFDEQKSRAAFIEFHRRYVRSLYSTCYYVCRMMPSREDAAADLVENVLIRAFAYANSYNPNRASIKTWLYKIAQNEFNDYYSNYRKNHPIKEDEDAETSEADFKIEENEDFTIDRTVINVERLEMALSTLTAMERDILMTHMLHKDIDNLDSQIPDEVMKDLCQTYKKKPNTIRKIKSRAMKKIRMYILRE